MFSPRFVLAGFTGDEDRHTSGVLLRILLDALTSIDILELQQGHYPTLYQSGVVYYRDPGKPQYWQDYKEIFDSGWGPEDWQDVAEMQDRMRADCKSLACRLAAERILQGIPAFAQFRWKDKEHGALYHIVTQYPKGGLIDGVQRPPGWIEDPSARLGMLSTQLLRNLFRTSSALRTHRVRWLPRPLVLPVPFPLIPAAIALAALAFSQSGKNPTPGGLPPGVPPTTPDQLVDPGMPAAMKSAVLAQLSTNQNPVDLFNLSIQCGAMGYPVAAQSCLAMCNYWRQKQGQNPIAYPAHIPYPLDAHTSPPNPNTPGAKHPPLGQPPVSPPQGLPPVPGIPPQGGPPGTPPAGDPPIVQAAKKAAASPSDKPTVKAFQDMYNKAGGVPPLKVDGLYGPKTSAVVKQYVSGAPGALPGLGGGGSPPTNPPAAGPPAPGPGDGFANPPGGGIDPNSIPGQYVDVTPSVDNPDPIFGKPKIKAHGDDASAGDDAGSEALDDALADEMAAVILSSNLLPRKYFKLRNLLRTA